MTTNTMTVQGKQISARRRDAMTGQSASPKRMTAWQIDGQGDRRDDPWATSIQGARQEAIDRASARVRAGESVVQVVVVGPCEQNVVTVDSEYVRRVDRERREYADLCERNRLACEQATAAEVARRQAAYEAALPKARALGLAGHGGSYQTRTDETNVRHHVDGPGMDDRDALPNYLAAVRTVLQHAYHMRWASVVVNGSRLDVADELAGDGWCRKWLLGARTTCESSRAGGSGQ